MLDQSTEAKTRVKLIGIAGPKGAGKSTLAEQLAMHSGFLRFSFAAPMKKMLSALNVPPVFLYGDDKDKSTPCGALNGHTVRHALQTLGTEWGRNCMGADFWVEQAMWQHAQAGGVPAVYDDVRFDNEADAIHFRDGIVVRIKGEPTGDTHPSEGGIEHVDYEVANDGEPHQMLDHLIELMAKDGRRL